MTSRYPLQDLLRLRRGIEEQRERQLAAAIAACQQVEGACAAAGVRLEEQRRSLAAARRALGAPELGRAAERQVRVRYADRLRREVERRADELRRAEQHALAARDACLSAQRALREASALLQVVERDHAAWDQARRADEERRAELELEELVAARQR
jgi:hypothetical protein